MPIIKFMPGWRNGRRPRLKILWEQSRAGSIPAPGTIQKTMMKIIVFCIRLSEGEHGIILLIRETKKNMFSETNNTIVSALVALSRFAASLVICIAALVWVGYFLNIQELKSLVNGATAMNPATALCFMLAGLSLLSLHSSNKRIRQCGALFAGTVALVGLVKFFSYLWGLPVYFDRVLFASQLDVVVLGYRNEIAPNTALNFFFAGFALWALHRGKQDRLPQVLAAATALLATLTLLGYMYGAPDLTQFNSRIPMALNTAIAFFLLSMAIIFVSPERGYTSLVIGKDAGAVVARRLLPVAILFPVLIGYAAVLVSQEGLLSIELISAFRVLVMIVVFFAVTWRLAFYLQKIDRERETGALRLYQEKMRDEALLSSIGDGLVAIDNDWMITLWNPAASLITGWTKEEVIGKPFRQIVRLIKESDRTESVSFISDAMLSGETRTMQNHVLLIRKDGREIPVGDSVAPIKDHEKRTNGAIIVFRDATNEKNKFLVSSDVAYASHQMRTPLTQALWSLELARTQKKSVNVDENIDAALQAMKSIQKMTNSLLDVSEIDSGTRIPKRKLVNIKKLVSGVVAAVRDEAKQKKITVLVAKMNPALSLRTDAKLLKRALVEVLENGIRYSPLKSSLRIKLSEPEDGILFQIEDEGVGVSDEQKPLVFTKFFRGHNVGEENPGAGLGLFIAKQYVQLLKGKIWFTSKEGEGSVFSIFIHRK